MKSITKLFTGVNIKAVIAAFVVVAGAVTLQAQTGGFSYPAAGTVPPANNTPAPLNVGNTQQSKVGSLTLNTDATNPLVTGLTVFGRTLLYPNVSGETALQVGTTALPGKVQYVDGNQGEGKILTSNANGVASWTATSTLGLGGAAPATAYQCSCRNGTTQQTSQTDLSTVVNPIDGITGSCATSGPKLEPASYYQWSCTTGGTNFVTVTQGGAYGDPTTSAFCPSSNAKVVSGGCRVTSGYSGTNGVTGSFVVETYPINSATGYIGAEGWYCRSGTSYQNPGISAVAVSAYAICSN